MLPPYRIEVLEYWDDSERITLSKPHIVFDDPELEPLAHILNWQFPDVERLTHARDFLLKPWHPAISERTIRVYENSYVELHKSGKATLLLWGYTEEEFRQIIVEHQDIINAYDEAIRIAKKLRGP